MKAFGLKTVAFLSLMAAFLLLVSSCGQIKYIPVPGETIIRDSISYVERVDTAFITLPPVKVKDYSDLRDTLHLDGEYETADCWLDQDRGLLVGEIRATDKPVAVPVKVIEKEVVRDSIVYQSVPFEVTKEVRYTPKFWKVTGIIGILSILLGMAYIYLKIRGIQIRI